MKKSKQQVQNRIVLRSDVLSPAEKSLLKKDQSFVPRPTDINWGNLPKDFDSTASKLCHLALKTEKKSVEDNPTNTPLSVKFLNLANHQPYQNLSI